MRKSTLWKNVKGYALSILITLLLVEGLCFVMVETEYIIARPPTYQSPKHFKPFYADLDEHFGVWRVPNSSFTRVQPCFEITYHTNSYGAIDQERELVGDSNRVVVLGDSFVEGYGVEPAQRFTNLLEAKSGKAHLNFGTSGNFGPTQYYLAYQHMASRFSHNAVLVALLPDNDFKDDEPEAHRYAPYWEGSYPDYTLAYTMSTKDSSAWAIKNIKPKSTSAQWLRNYTYMWNVGDYIISYLKFKKRASASTEGEPVGLYHGYYDYSKEQLLRMRYSLEQLRTATEGKRLMVISIPRYQDLVKHAHTGSNPFGTAMTQIASELGFEYFDLLPPLHQEYGQASRWAELFHTCDGHWSPNGHAVASQLINQEFYQ